MTAALQKPLADEDKIVTRHIFPPIPMRQFDWQATRDGYEPGCPIGYGKTESEAIADLHAAEDEAREDAMPPDLTDQINRSRNRMRLAELTPGYALFAAREELTKIFAAYDRERTTDPIAKMRAIWAMP
jgi:hypothetical protein